MTASALLLIC